jgi:HD-GYP domain-containing protein (c-di-GMP phosphodiesterase class II)
VLCDASLNCSQQALFCGEIFSNQALLEKSTHLAVQVVQKSRALIQNETEVTGKLVEMSTAFTDYGMRTCYAAPVLFKGEVKGVIEVFQEREMPAPEAEWIEYLETLAGQAAIAIANSDLLENLRRKNDELMDAYESTIAGWARALEIRDRETFGHSERVLAMALQVAKAMSMSEEDQSNFRRGVLLHDIGKIGVPDAILLKPGPLDEEEWKIMRQHPVLAFHLLKDIPFLQGALDVAYCHHERWNGSGYPRGLKGEKIPVSARIFAVVDVWDALTNDRPYRHAWTLQQAKDYLRENAGIQFDAEIVEIFLKLIL